MKLNVNDKSLTSNYNKRSFSQKERWATARVKKSIWEKHNPESTYNLREFYKNENVLDENIEVHNMSVQVDYASNYGGLKIDSQTFQVYALRGVETSNAIDTNVKEAYQNMIYTDTSETFNPGFQSAIKNHTKVTPEEVRGLETYEGERKKLTMEEYSSLATGQYLIKDFDSNLSASKQKRKGKPGKGFNVKVDLADYM